MTYISLANIYLLLLYLSSRKDEAVRILKLDIYKNVLPLFDDVNISSNMILVSMTLALLALIPNKPFGYINFSGQLRVSDIFDISQLNTIIDSELGNFTTKFLNFGLVNKVPLYLIYSSSDEFINIKLDNGTIIDGVKLFDTDSSCNFPNNYIQSLLKKDKTQFLEYETSKQNTDIISIKQEFTDNIKTIDTTTIKYIKCKVNSPNDHSGFYTAFIDYANIIIS